MTIFKKLKSLRTELKLTLREVAEISGVSNPLISQLETGKVKQPGFFTIVKLAKVYGIRLDDLINEKIITSSNEQAKVCVFSGDCDRQEISGCTEECDDYPPVG